MTAEFNKNVLAVLNRELGADFEPDAFEHRAVWDAEHEWIEMRLESTEDQRVHVAALDLDVDFAAGEQMRTEISAKFRASASPRSSPRRGCGSTALVDRPGRRLRALAVRAGLSTTGSRVPVDSRHGRAAGLHSAERMKFFTDAVVAIAMTLLILPLLESVAEAAKPASTPRRTSTTTAASSSPSCSAS